MLQNMNMKKLLKNFTSIILHFAKASLLEEQTA